VDGDIIV